MYRWKELAKKGKTEKIPLKEDDKHLVEDIQNKLQKATEQKANAKTDQEKLAAASFFDEVKQLQKNVHNF